MSGPMAITAGTAIDMSGSPAAGSSRLVQASSGFRDTGPSAAVAGYGLRVTGGSRRRSLQKEALCFHARRSVFPDPSRLRASCVLFVRPRPRTCFAVAVTAALQQKNLAALRAFPRKHAELGVEALLHEPVPGNPGQFHFVAIGTGLLSLTHPLPSETGR